MEPTIRHSVQLLDIPSSFADTQLTSSDGNAALQRDESWISKATVTLSELREYLNTVPDTSEEDDAHIVVACAPFEQDRQWCSSTSKSIANDILQRYATPDASLLRIILGEHVKPAFQVNPHPSLNVNTGRRITSHGGALSQQDYLENQVWKQNLGLFDIVAWCLRHMNTSMYEQLWPFVIPPLMTFLDDYEVRYKLQGVLLVQLLLRGVPPELLKRTGLDALILTSMKKSMTFLHNPMTPALFLNVIPTSVKLIEATTAPGSAERFNQLCDILGDGIIGSVWTYGSSDRDSIEASVEVLPDVVAALGIGTVRFLKAIVPQLVHTLMVSQSNPPPIRLQLLSARALVMLIEHCSARMSQWKATILDGIARAWTCLADSGLKDAESQELKVALRHAASVLARACPSLTTDELGFPLLLRADAELFQPLFSDVTSIGIW